MTTSLVAAGKVAAAYFDEKKINLIKRQIMQGKGTDDELALFLYQCEKTQLDPLARQIYAVFRKTKVNSVYVDKMSIQTSIDGFRLIAQRSGDYAGQTGPLWCGEDGVWKDVWLGNAAPWASKVGVWREGFKEPCWGVARMSSYSQKYEGKLTGQWASMPEVMIAKCAEALALRKAFPQELSGLYTSDEMDQAKPKWQEDVIETDVQPAQEPKAIEAAGAPSDAQECRKFIDWTLAMAGQYNIKEAELKDICKVSLKEALKNGDAVAAKQAYDSLEFHIIGLEQSKGA